jgi:hypothetical protein
MDTFLKRSSFRFGVALVFTLALCAATASADSILYNFPGFSGDGTGPKAKPVADTFGNLYGTTTGGGANGFGAVFVVCAPNAPAPDVPPCTPGASSWGPEIVLYSFTGPANHDGAEPTSTLTFAGVPVTGRSFTLYGTTLFGGNPNALCGSAGCGTVFELCAPSSIGGCSTSTTQWQEKVLWSFYGGKKDGSNPYAGLIYDGHGFLYGTTISGGGKGTCNVINPYCGIVYRITHNTAYTGWTEDQLHHFKGAFTEGANPYARLCCASNSTIPTLYGTTVYGGTPPTNLGSGNSGSVFSITNSGSYPLTTLYSFCNDLGCPDGANPFSHVSIDSNGNFFGTTAYGGSRGEGTTYEVSSSNVVTAPLYTFCMIGNCADGAVPIANLKIDANNNLYGTTNLGGSNLFGEVFEFPFGSYTAPPIILWNFTGGPLDGGNPYAGVIFDQPVSGTSLLYGFTPYSGTFGDGVIYSQVP